jgi:hypothetical protein
VGVETGRPQLSEEALTRMQALASKAKDWDLAEQLSAQLKALAAATPPNVTSIDAARKRRDEGSGGK